MTARCVEENPHCVVVSIDTPGVTDCLSVKVVGLQHMVLLSHTSRLLNNATQWTMQVFLRFTKPPPRAYNTTVLWKESEGVILCDRQHRRRRTVRRFCVPHAAIQRQYAYYIRVNRAIYVYAGAESYRLCARPRARHWFVTLESKRPPVHARYETLSLPQSAHELLPYVFNVTPKLREWVLDAYQGYHGIDLLKCVARDPVWSSTHLSSDHLCCTWCKPSKAREIVIRLYNVVRYDHRGARRDEMMQFLYSRCHFRIVLERWVQRISFVMNV
jgi:hypothetical protein